MGWLLLNTSKQLILGKSCKLSVIKLSGGCCQAWLWWLLPQKLKQPQKGSCPFPLLLTHRIQSWQYCRGCLAISAMATAELRALLLLFVVDFRFFCKPRAFSGCKSICLVCLWHRCPDLLSNYFSIYVSVFLITETKIEESYYQSQFQLTGFHKWKIPAICLIQEDNPDTPLKWKHKKMQVAQPCRKVHIHLAWIQHPIF